MEETPKKKQVAGDHVVRAITIDDNFRVITATTSNMVRDAIAVQKIEGRTAEHFGNLMTGTVLIRETMAPSYRVQAVLKGAGGQGTIVADAHPDGMTRGLVEFPTDRNEVDLGEGSALQMMRSMAKGNVYRSVVQPPPGGGVEHALMTYLQESEQIVSVIRIGTMVNDDGTVDAGGFVVQLLPDAARGALMIMTERLEALPPIHPFIAAAGGSARGMLDELLYGMEFAQLDDQPIHHGCNCSMQSVVGALATVAPSELSEMLEEDGYIELTCDYCKTDYQIGHAQLAGLLQTS